MYKNIKVKKDGTFVVDFNGMPFHITEEYPTEDMYGIEMTYAEVKKYVDSHQDEVREYEEPVYTLDPKIEKEILIAKKEKEKIDIMTNILTDIDVEANKEKLKTIIAEIEELKVKEEEPTDPEILVLREDSVVQLKKNTKYEITNNIGSIVASGTSISIRYDLYYTNDTDEQRLNRIEYHNTTKIKAPAKIVFTTNDNSSSHILSLILDGSKYGSLSKDVEYYIQEIVQ